MAMSMTGFGRGTLEEAAYGYTVEIKSVNNRFLEINVRMPRTLISLEDKIRKSIQQRLNRGKVDVFITANVYDRNDVEANFNASLGDSYVKCLEEIGERYGIKNDISVSLLSRFPDVISVKQKEENLDLIWQNLMLPLNDGIDAIIAMRKVEGEKLKEDTLKRVDNIKLCLDKIEGRAPMLVEEYRAKLTERLKNMIQSTEVDESRIAMEVAIIADKVSVDEEIVRLNSHLCQMKTTLELEEPIGRKLDFIVQEMNRETNTIGSKASDLELVNLVLNIKNEIEKIREQIQNIE